MKKLLFTLAILTLSGRSVLAVLVVNDNFDSYANQAAFEAVWTPIGTTAPLSGALSTAQAVSAPNSISTPGTVTNNQSRNQLTFAATPVLTPGDQLVFSFDFYDSSPTGNPQRNYVNLQTVTGPSTSPAGQLISMGTNNNQLSGDSGGNYYLARILGFSHTAVDPEGGPNEAASGTASGAYFKLNDTGAGLRGTTAGWHNLKVVITDVNATSVNDQFYVDSLLAETITNSGPPLQYTVIRLGSGLGNSNVGAFFDNMRLEYIPAVAVPEASGVLLGSLVCLVVGITVGGRKLLQRRAAADGMSREL
jgi:hypothetical protein